MGEQKFIEVRGAREHNLKNVDVEIPRDKLTVITGLSGSGKSSLAFDTIYAEGQRRYVESLSAYARQFLDMMGKPDVDHISGLSPAISIEQKTTSKNPRSTVGTVTEIYDYLRLLFARVGTPYSAPRPVCRSTAHAGAGHGRCGDGDGRGDARPTCWPPSSGTGRASTSKEFHRPGGSRGFKGSRSNGQSFTSLEDAADAGQEAAPRHRRRGRPDRGARTGCRRGWPTVFGRR